MSQPKLAWNVHAERDHAYVITGNVHMSIVNATDGNGANEWRGYAFVGERGDTWNSVDLHEDSDCGTGDIVDAMARCEELTRAALVKLGGGLVK